MNFHHRLVIIYGAYNATALHIASANDQRKVVTLLLDIGACTLIAYIYKQIII